MIDEVIKDFRIRRRLGKGGMGEVWLAEQQIVKTKVAIKFLVADVSSDHQLAQRFFNEAIAVSKIKHAGTVKIFDVGYHHGSAYLIMEMLEGETLATRIRRAGRLPLGQVGDFGRQIAGILDATHAAQIIHRDLKPENIFLIQDAELASGERVKILDFGIAKLGTATTMTGAGGTMGTPGYMAPEQWGNAASVDGRADVYALGCIVFKMCCGRQPFEAASIPEAYVQHLKDTPPRVRSFAPDVPPELDEAIAAALAKQPVDRPSLVELMRVFDGVVAAHPPLRATRRGGAALLFTPVLRADVATTLPPAAPTGQGEPGSTPSSLDFDPTPVDEPPSLEWPAPPSVPPPEFLAVQAARSGAEAPEAPSPAPGQVVPAPGRAAPTDLVAAPHRRRPRIPRPVSIASAIAIVIGAATIGYAATRDDRLSEAQLAEVSRAVTRLDTDITAARSAVRERAAALSSRFPVRAVVSTDEATARDLVADGELAAHDGEILELGRIDRRTHQAEPLVVLPEGAPRVPHGDVPGAHVELVGGQLAVAEVVEVLPIQEADRYLGLLGVSRPLELASVMRPLREAGIAGKLVVGKGELAFGALPPGAATSEQALHGAGDARIIAGGAASGAAIPMPILVGAIGAAVLGVVLLAISMMATGASPAATRMSR
ncbi:MAG TPA: serine/threonine-protein kinase [Kofleriaceae bacterium]|nr:serine/threonine-protein kinase [Kofleriaceae bacterium]